MQKADCLESQSELFRKAAESVEADQSDDALDRIMRKLDLTKKPDETDGRDE